MEEEEEKFAKDVKSDTKIDIPPEHESPPRPPPTTHDVKPSSPSNGKAPAAEAEKQSGYLRRFLDGLVAMLLVVICVPFFLLYLLYALGAKVFFRKDVLADPDHTRRFFEGVGFTLAVLLFWLPCLLFLLGAKVFGCKEVKEVFGWKEVLSVRRKEDGGPFQKAQELVDGAFRLAKLSLVIRNRVSVFILLWLIINLSIVGLRKKNVLGSELWKWTLLIVILSCGYPAINMVVQKCLDFLEHKKGKKDRKDKKGKKGKKEVLYYARGLRRSINFVIFFCMLLLIWLFYFRSDHGLKQTSGTEKVFDLGTRTLISLLIFALLWLFKSILLLKWAAHVVYKRFLDRILRAGFQVYFLALMSGKSWVIFRPKGNRSSEETQEEGDTNDNNSVLSGEATIPEGNKTEEQRKAKGSRESYEENKNGAEEILPAGDQQKQGEVPNDNNNVSSGDRTIPEGTKTEEQRKAKGSRESYEENKNGAKETLPAGDQQKQENKNGAEEIHTVGDQQKQEENPNDNNYVEEQENRKRAKDILHVEEHMLSKNVSTYAIQQMAKYFVALKVSSREGGDDTAGIFAKFELDDEDTKQLHEQLQEGKLLLKRFAAWLRQRDCDYLTKRYQRLSRPLKLDLLKQLNSKRKVSYEKFKDWVVHYTFPRDHDYVTKKDLKRRFNLDEKDTDLLYKQLQDGKSEVSYEMFKDWVMKAFNNCLTLGQTLLDAEEVVNCLKNILNCFVFAMSILSWLLLTEFATTKVLVLIASPLLAASFIFGDTCKAMFEGIIFAFIKHPFDVGDLCVIDETEMEVKQINTLTTTFLRLDTKRDALYPNSVLAAKAIINLKFKPDLNDSIELSLDSSTKKKGIDDLETEIKNYIDKSEKFERSGHVMMKHIGNNIKIVVHFQHIMSTLDATHSQCREKKNKQRSEFLLQIKHSLDELNIKTV